MIAGVPHPVQAFRRCAGVLGYAKRKGKAVLEACCADAVRGGKCNYSYIKNTIADYEVVAESMATVGPEAAEVSVKPHKVDASRYSIEAILGRQGEKGEEECNG